MVLPVLKNFTVTKGVTFSYPWQWLIGVVGSNTAQNLTGYTGTMAITDWNAATTYKTLVTGNTLPASGIYFGGQQQTPSNGIIDIVISATDTAAFTFATARYNLSVTAPDTTVTRLLYGTVVVDGSLP
jgi:hypothetical protein